jgi:hypothetical protein
LQETTVASYLIAINDARKSPNEAVVEVTYDGSSFTWRSKTPGAFRVRDDDTHGAFSGITRNSPVFLARYKEGSFNCFQLLNFFDTVRGDPRGRSVRGEGQIFREGAGTLQDGDMTWVLLPFKT